LALAFLFLRDPRLNEPTCALIDEASVSCRLRDGDTTEEFIRDLRERVIGLPELSNDAVTEASRRYSPAAVVAVSREVVTGVPADISTSYVERSNLTLRQSCKRFARLGLGFSKEA
jgi:hypothetical protein